MTVCGKKENINFRGLSSPGQGGKGMEQEGLHASQKVQYTFTD